MQIVLTHRTQGIGAEGVHVAGMVEAFRDLGHEVVVDCLPGCDPTRPTIGPGPGPVGTGLVGRRIGRTSRLYHLIARRAPQSIFGLIELLYNVPLCLRLGPKLVRRPDLVYERYSMGNLTPSLLCRLLGVPLVLEVNDSVVTERSRPTAFPRLQRILERRILASADLIITISRRFKDRLLDAYPQIPESKIIVLPNAISGRRFASDRPACNPDPSLRSALRLGNRTILGTTGQFLPWHGLVALVSAAAGLARDRNLGFLFVGDGPSRAEVTQMAQLAGVSERVVFTGMIPQGAVPNHLALLDVAVIPASNEHCSPMKLVEFMAMGLPIVAPDLPNIREILEDGRTGRLFRPDDMGDLCRCLSEVLDDLEAGRAMGHRARAHVLAHLTWSGHARAILTELMRGRSPREAGSCTS